MESQALFAEAQALAAAGKYVEACPKFEASIKLEKATGSLYYLADCYEHTGRLASAYGTFKNVEDLVTDKAQEREAHNRAKALEPRLVRVVIDLPEQVRKAIPNLTVQRGEVALVEGQFGTAVPVDPGAIVISATAPGKKRWQVSLAATKEGATLTVQVPLLEDALVQGAPAPVAAPQLSWTPQRIAGVTGAGLGLVALGVGGAFGGVALDKKSASEKDGHCDKAVVCDSVGLALRHDGRAMGDASTAMFIVAGAFTAGGVVLYLTAPKADEKASEKSAMAMYFGVGMLGVRRSW